MTPAEAFVIQANACESLGSPFTARLLRLLAPRLTPGPPIIDRLLVWPGDLSPSGASIALRLAGAFHALVLRGDAPALCACYPPHDVPDARLLAALEDALTTHAAHLQHWLDSPPQTNEMRRSAVLIAAGHWLTARHGLPMVLSELGASAGLNLLWDRLRLDMGSTARGPADAPVTLSPDWQGALPDAPPRIAERRGVDLNPLDPACPEDRLRLMSYLWADQTDRLARTRAGLEMAVRIGAPVDRSDAAPWLAARLATPRPGHLHLVYHTVAWQYFPAAVQAACTASLEAAGARATREAPLAWLGMEADGETPGAGLTLRLWPGGLRIGLGRADFHGRWVAWKAP